VHSKILPFVFALMLAASGTATAQVDLARGLVLHLPFEGNSADTSPVHHPTQPTGTIDFQSGAVGQCAVFNGEEFVLVPDHPSLQVKKFTLASWVYRVPSRSNARIMEKGAGQAFWLWMYGRKMIGGFFGDDFTEVYSKGEVPQEKWTHICTTYNGTVLSMYVNGILESTTKVTGEISTTNRPLFIGCRNKKTDFWSGGLDEVRIYDRDLNPAEVSALAVRAK
jgi:hypothetical protein